jgi:nucleotide-binding universal stress UspA family protein
MGPVVVGIDGSDESAAALRVALAEARLRGLPVVAVHVWHVPALEYLSGYPPLAGEVARLEHEARWLLAESVGDAPVEQVLVERDAVGRALVDEAAERRAELLVVGCRGLGRMRGLVGSVSRFCSTHAGCPVLVVHAPAADAEAGVAAGPRVRA